MHGFDFSYEGLLGIWEGIQPLPDIDLASPVHRDALDVPNDPNDQYGSRRAQSPADNLYGNFHEAIKALAIRTGANKSAWKPPVSTSKLLQRQIALQLCGWSLREEDMTNIIKKYVHVTSCIRNLHPKFCPQVGKRSETLSCSLLASFH